MLGRFLDRLSGFILLQEHILPIWNKNVLGKLTTEQIQWIYAELQVKSMDFNQNFCNCDIVIAFIYDMNLFKLAQWLQWQSTTQTAQ